MTKQRGFTLVELMIGITIGLIVIAGGTTFFVSVLIASSDGVKQQQLEQTAQVLVSTIAADIRRAGYTPPGQATPSLTINGKYIYANGDCLLLTYRNADNTVAYRGYLRDDATKAIYVLKSQGVQPLSCAVSDTAWNPTPVTDSTQFTVNSPNTAPSPSGTVSGAVFQADGIHAALKWIHLRLASTSLKTQSGAFVTRDIVAAVALRN